MGRANPMRAVGHRPWRRLRLAALACAGALLLGGAVAAVRQVADGARREVSGLLRQAGLATSTAVEEEFSRATATTLLMARHPALSARTPNRAGIAKALSAGLAGDDGRVISVALLDLKGRVLVQVADGSVISGAIGQGRSSDSAVTSSTVALSVGVVRHSAPYRSRETGRWVVASSTVVTPDVGRAPRVLVTLTDLAAFRDRMLPDARVFTRIIDRDGSVIVQSRGAGPSDGPVGVDVDRESLSLAASGISELTASGHAFSFTPVEASSTNMNRWWVAVSMPAAGNGSLLRAGGPATAMALASMLLLVLGAMAIFRHRDSLRVARLTDPLTGLMNRSALAERGDEVLAQGAIAGHHTAVVCLGVANLRQVNTALGHAAGDAMVVSIATRLREAVQGGDLVVRLGGDEFAVLLSKVADRDGAERAVRGLMEQVSQPIRLADHDVSPQPRAGIALAPADGVTVGALVERAAHTMYAAADAGASLRLADPSVTATDPRRLELQTQLCDADERGELQLAYAAVIDLGSGSVVGAHAQLAWHHPLSGVLDERTIAELADAETADKLFALSLTLALSRARTWADEGLELPVALTVDAASLRGAPVEHVTRTLTRWRIPPRMLELRVAIPASVAQDHEVAGALGRLSTLGVTVTRAPFEGLSALHQTTEHQQVAAVVVDATELVDAAGSDEALNHVRSAIAVAHARDRIVIASGLSDATQVRAALTVGCDRAQGPFIHQPGSADDLYRWLRRANAPRTLRFAGR